MAPAAREHGTRARYVWGPDGQGRAGRGCRCGLCTGANRAAASHRDRMILYGQWQPYVDAAPAREHVRALAAAGIGWKRAAGLAGLSGGAMTRLLYGGPGGRPATRRIRAETARKILAVRPGAESLGGGALVDATGTRRRLQALVAIGHSQSALARRLGQLPSNFAAAMTRRQVTAATDRAVRALYDELWDAAPDESTHRGRICASRARNHARERGWPLGWDEPEIDDPAAGPAEGWQRSDRTAIPSRELAEDAEFVRLPGGCQTRSEVAIRLGVSRDRLEQACARAARQAAGAEKQAG